MAKSFVLLSNDGKRESFIGEFRTEVEAQIRLTAEYMAALDQIMLAGFHTESAVKTPAYGEIVHEGGQIGFSVHGTY